MNLLAEFLAKEEWRKYQLLKKLERSPYFAIPKKKLMEDLGISNYVLKSLIDQLILDLEHYQLAEEIHIFIEEPFLQMEITGAASSESLLEKYVAASISFQILAGSALGQFKSLNELSEKKMISYPIAHSNYKKLNGYLSKFGMTIDKKFRLSGNSEKNVRLFLTEIFARIFKNLQDCYTSADKSIIETKLATLEKTNMTIHQKIKLMHYLYVTNLRIQQERYVEEQQIELLPTEFIKKEEATPFFYRLPLEKSAKITQWSQNLSQQLLASFPKLQADKASQAEFIARCNFLHFQLLETSAAYESIQPEINIIYFQQNYPGVLAFCRDYLTSIQNVFPELYQKKKNLLLQYLFLILAVFPKHLLLKAVNVYVDFSYGHLYNQFITQNLDFFQQVGAKITTDIDTADILLTDSRELGAICQKDCVVWLAPPRPLDWANLAQKVIQKREAKYNGDYFAANQVKNK